jgi:Na+/H+ antiporter NhaD/arsenite permease-like protein
VAAVEPGEQRAGGDAAAAPPGPAGTPGSDQAGLLLALASTFAGNLLLVGSIANLIVVDGAEKNGITIDWHQGPPLGPSPRTFR